MNILKKIFLFGKEKEEKRYIIENLLDDKQIWYLNTGRSIRARNNMMNIHLSSNSSNMYLICGTKIVRQTKPSPSLIDIAGTHTLTLFLDLFVSNLVTAEVFVQFFTKDMLVESMKYKLISGSNRIDIENLSTTFSYMKILLKFSSKERLDNNDIVINKIDIHKELNEKKSINHHTIQDSLIPCIPHTKLQSNYLLHEGEFTYQIDMESTSFNFYLNYKLGNKLIIALPGATDRKKPFYNFQRYSWSQNIDCSFMSILDPTIKKDNDLTIGWFQGDKDNYALEKLVELLKRIFIKNNIDEKNVIFFGSSAGGYGSLKLASYFSNSIAIVINPQVYIYNYSSNIYNKLLEEVYSESAETVYSKYKNRLEVDLNLSKRNAPIFYFQNIYDKHHMVKHLKPLLKRLNEQSELIQVQTVKIYDTDFVTSMGSVKDLNIMYYEDPENGHSPPNKEITLKIINTICNNL